MAIALRAALSPTATPAAIAREIFPAPASAVTAWVVRPCAIASMPVYSAYPGTSGMMATPVYTLATEYWAAAAATPAAPMTAEAMA